MFNAAFLHPVLEHAATWVHGATVTFLYWDENQCFGAICNP